MSVESLAKTATATLLVYALMAFISYICLAIALAAIGIYRGDIGKVFVITALVMCFLIYGSAGLHLYPGSIKWFGQSSEDQRGNVVLGRTLALLGSLVAAFLCSAYLYFDLFKNYWQVLFPLEA